MLNPEYLLRISEGAEEIAEQLHIEIIKRVVARILIRLARGEEYRLTATDKWQLETLQDAGILLEDIQKEIAEYTALQQAEIATAMLDAGVETLRYDNSVYKVVGLDPAPFRQSPDMIRIMMRNQNATFGEWENFTRTTASEAQQLFISECDKAYTLVSSGAVSLTEAVAEAVDTVSTHGVLVHYPSGHTDTLETATLRAVRTGIGQMSGQISMQRMEEMDWDTVLVSAHLGARVTDKDDCTNHAWWQGKFYSRSGKDKRFPPFSVCGEGNVQGILGANCRHSYGPGDGVHNPYEQYDSEENKEDYELSQRQRLLERRIRKTKRRVMGLQEAIDNAQTDEQREAISGKYREASAMLGRQNREYNDFCEANGLKRQADRIQIARWGREQAKRSMQAEKEAQG